MSNNCSCEFSDNPCSSCLIANRDELIVTLQKGFDEATLYASELSLRIMDLQKDNDTLNTDLKEAEGAVADLMELNDTLTVDMKNLLTSEQTLVDELAKAEAERERYLEDYQTALKDGLVTAGALEDVMKERDELKEALNHKEK